MGFAEPFVEPTPDTLSGEETRTHLPERFEPLSLIKTENHTMFFLRYPDLQKRRDKSGTVETADKRKNLFFQLQKVCLPHISCANNEVRTSLYRRHGQP
ncbi:hypothetical protein Hanom_Chr06g00485601 [Helianthus anomalus]